jgi:5-methylcytosine-specific restriction endonuclease McrA
VQPGATPGAVLSAPLDTVVAMLTKTCTKCGVEYPATAEHFYRDKTGKYGLRGQCKLCVETRLRSYRQRPEVRERTRELQRGRKEYKRAWQRANPDKQREYDARWYEKHRDEARSRNRARRRANRAYYRAYYFANKGQYRAHQRRRRAALRGSHGQHTAADVALQYGRQRGRCYWCRAKVGDDYHVDHVIPVALGGSNGPENIVIACPTCNTSKGAKHPMDFAGRLF